MVAEAELRERDEVYDVSLADVLHFLTHLDQSVGLAQRGDQPRAVARKLSGEEAPIIADRTRGVPPSSSG